MACLPMYTLGIFKKRKSTREKCSCVYGGEKEGGKRAMIDPLIKGKIQEKKGCRERGGEKGFLAKEGGENIKKHYTHLFFPYGKKS